MNAGMLLAALSAVAIGLCAFAMQGVSFTGLYALVGISGCMSLMFPTIYGIGLKGLGEDSKLAAAGLVMAIAGGSILPLAQAAVVDAKGVSFSFVLPLICFVVIALYGLRVMLYHDRRSTPNVAA